MPLQMADKDKEREVKFTCHTLDGDLTEKNRPEAP